MTSVYLPKTTNHCPIDFQSWLKEGLILQTNTQILLGEGPLLTSNRPGQGFFHPDFFFEKKKPWIFPKKTFSTTRTLIEQWLDDAITKHPSIAKKPIFHQTHREDFHQPQKITEQPSFTEFHTVFAQLQQKINQGILKKGVPVFFENRNEKIPFPYLLQALLKKTATINREGFLYGIWNSKKGLLGFSPEMLFSFSEKELSLMALAGTGPWLGPSLLHDPKEMQEHQWVIQSIKESLKDLAIWNDSPTQEKKFGSLKHLHTKIKGTLKQPADFTFLCKKLHPTAALGGFPKQAALHWLKETPHQKNRGYFGAPFGYFDGKTNGFCLIALRGIEWNPQGLQIGAGCGLVKNSILQKEWRELTLKRNQIKQFFHLIPQP
ncbi:MAG: chorismate-binding protein [Bdellovibrionales bacterium]|nr:chorismate-binding protein [Bdellovibrionales bacterium]